MFRPCQLKTPGSQWLGTCTFLPGLWRGPSSYPVAPAILYTHHHLPHASTTETCHLLPGLGETLCLASAIFSQIPFQP